MVTAEKGARMICVSKHGSLSSNSVGCDWANPVIINAKKKFQIGMNLLK